MRSDDAFFSRQRAFDPSALECLRRSSAAVFGLGNIGGPVPLELGRAGIGELLLVDHGRVEEANLSRGIFSARDLGETKVAAAQRILAERAPFTHVATLHGDVRVDVPEYLFSKYDVVIVAVDSWSARMFISRWAHALPGRTRAVVSGGLAGLSWDVIVAVPGTWGGCMQCPHQESIALSDEEGGCSSGGSGDHGFDPSVSFAGLAAAAQIVSAVVDVLSARSLRLAGRMISFDHDRYQLDVLRIARSPACSGHRRLRPDEFVTVPIADYVVGDLAALVARRLGVDDTPILAVEREFVTTRTCSRCAHVDAVGRPLIAYRRGFSRCSACGSAEATVLTDTVLPAQARLSELGVPPGKAVRAHVNGRWPYVIPNEGGAL